MGHDPRFVCEKCGGAGFTVLQLGAECHCKCGNWWDLRKISTEVLQLKQIKAYELNDYITQQRNTDE